MTWSLAGAPMEIPQNKNASVSQQPKGLVVVFAFRSVRNSAFVGLRVELISRDLSGFYGAAGQD